MRLIKLSANSPGFKTIHFNRSGISLIVGRRHNNDYSKDKKNTYNSVGKSLAVALIHFCLGSSKNAEFETKLKDWEFTLDFELEGTPYSVRRLCSQQNLVYLNEQETPLREYTDFLASKTFSIPENSKYLSFRSLLPRFVRPKKASYNSFDDFQPQETDFARLLNNSLLLGLDTSLVFKKSELKEQLDKIDQMRKAFENDTVIKSFFDHDDDDGFDVDIVDLKQKIQKLEADLQRFQVAEDYYEIIDKADALKRDIKALETKVSSTKVAISNIDKSLTITPDIPKKRIEQLYRDAQFNLPESIKKTLAEVEEFNKKILDDRTKRLISEKTEFQRKLSEYESRIKRLGKEKDQHLAYLDTRGALDEFTKLNDQLKDYKIRLDSIEKYRQLKEEYKNKMEELKREFSLENSKTSEYLSGIRPLIESNIVIFKDLAGEFYSKKKAGIEIKNNDGVNRNRFEIKARIDDDKGDGVNDVKIFCFDWTILLGEHNHKIKFLFHDSRLLSEIDSRQQATLFRVAKEKTGAKDLQYIISVNQNTLESLKMEMELAEFKETVEDNIVLELTDESDQSKLLGIRIDLDYDEE